MKNGKAIHNGNSIDNKHHKPAFGKFIKDSSYHFYTFELAVFSFEYFNIGRFKGIHCIENLYILDFRNRNFRNNFYKLVEEKVTEEYKKFITDTYVSFMKRYYIEQIDQYWTLSYLVILYNEKKVEFRLCSPRYISAGDNQRSVSDIPDIYFSLEFEISDISQIDNRTNDITFNDNFLSKVEKELTDIFNKCNMKKHHYFKVHKTFYMSYESSQELRIELEEQKKILDSQNYVI